MASEIITTVLTPATQGQPVVSDLVLKRDPHAHFFMAAPRRIGKTHAQAEAAAREALPNKRILVVTTGRKMCQTLKEMVAIYCVHFGTDPNCVEFLPGGALPNMHWHAWQSYDLVIVDEPCFLLQGAIPFRRIVRGSHPLLLAIGTPTAAALFPRGMPRSTTTIENHVVLH